MLLDIQEALQIGKAMIAEGKLQLDVIWDGKQITGVSIRSSRPLAACRILEGKPAAGSRAAGAAPLQRVRAGAGRRRRRGL
ncbi:MAG: hypothetical protein M5R42_18230 [Rhodocyclaceae bacterium]|nr:hypothetical protein [Rhodocyclaceae bacterium]